MLISFIQGERNMNMPVGLLAATLIFLPEPCNAQRAYSDWTRIMEIRTGWVVDAMAVFTRAPLANPGGCQTRDAGYSTNPADSGHQLFHSVLLAALINGRDVRILAEGCAFEQPRIIGVDIR